MSKSTRALLIFFFLAMLVICGLGSCWVSRVSQQFGEVRTEALTAGDDIVRRIADGWNYSTIDEVADEDFFRMISQSRIEELLDEFRPFGNVRTISSQDLTGVNVNVGPEGRVMRMNYLADVEFVGGRATIRMTLIKREENPWRIASFIVDERPRSGRGAGDDR